MSRTLPQLALLGIVAVGSASAQEPAKPAVPETFAGTIRNPKGDPIGTMTIRDGANALVMRVSIRPGGLPPGWHGMNFHAVGDCSDPKFMNAKALVNHDQSKHGLLNPDGPTEGDLPNLYAAQDGSAYAEVTSETPLNGEGGLKDGDGSALIVHADEDDHASQPIGGAGDRIACAVIR